MILPPVIFAGLAVLFFVGMNRSDPRALPSTFIGRQAPGLAATPVGSLSSFDRAALEEPGLKLVNFWASWCPPCRAEHPTLIKLANDLPIYGVNQDVKPADALDFLDDLGNPFKALIYDGNKRQSIDWGVYGLPETFLIDGDGTVLLRIAGPLTNRVLADKLRPAMEQAAK
ncbi:MAG: DsbE family thiol:disulfide interchange protein [Rhodobacteraceae bacterium]|nr:DsbE family thiol:disulfide interchange protein [Paracoccaceae bacterium]